MDITMDYFEGLEELFDQDITEEYLAESFNTGPIKFENIFDDNQTDQFDSIVPEDMSHFLDTEINEGTNTTCLEENFNLENVLDGNNNTSEIDKIDCIFDFDNPEAGVTSQIKQELKDIPEMESIIKEPLDFLNFPTSVNQVPFSDYNHLFTFEHASKTVKQEQVSKSDEDRKIEAPIGQNCMEIKNVKSIKLEVMDESSTKKKYPILPSLQADEIDLKSKKGKHSPTRKINTKDMKAFQFCDLCPFKTKEKSIFRMHQTLVHKLDVTKCPKKAPQKPETTRKSYQPPPKKLKVNESTRHEVGTKKDISITTNEKNGYHVTQTQPNSFVISIAPVNSKPVNLNPINNQVNFNLFSHNTDSVGPVMTNHVSCVTPANSSYVSSIFPPVTGGMASFVPPNTVGSNSFVPLSTTGLASFVPSNTAGLANFVPSNTAGLASFVPPNTAGLANFVPSNTTGLASFVPPNTAGLANFVPSNTSGLTSIARFPKVCTASSSQVLPAKPGIVRVASCKIISPAPRKFVSILPKGPQSVFNRFQQPNGKNPYQSSGRLLRNSQERQRRNETKQALQTVKNLVPRLTFAEKPSQITILNETIKYVKYLQKEEKEDLEELEAQKKTFMKLKSKCRYLVSRS